MRSSLRKASTTSDSHAEPKVDKVGSVKSSSKGEEGDWWQTRFASEENDSFFDSFRKRRKRLGFRIESIKRRHRKRVEDGIGHPWPRVRRIVLSQPFEIAMAFLIVSNCIFIGWQAEQRDFTSQTKVVTEFLDNFFTACFFTELCLRFLCFNWTMILASENHLDIFLVALSVLTIWILKPAQVNVPILRKLTVLRTMRLVRLARAVRHRPECKEMWELIRGLTNSGELLFWMYVMIATLLYFFAILGTQIFGKSEEFVNDDVAGPVAREYFSDVPSAMFTLLQVMTLDSWSDLMRSLMEANAFIAVAFFCIFVSVAVFVLMNLFTAVVVQSTFDSAKDQSEVLATKARLERAAELNLIREFLHEIDVRGDGKATYKELAISFNAPDIRQKLEKLGISMKDFKTVWETLDGGNNDKMVSIDEFVLGLEHLRREARAKDIMRAHRELKLLIAATDSLEIGLEESSDRLMFIDAQLEDTSRSMDGLKRTLITAKEAARLAARSQAQA